MAGLIDWNLLAELLTPPAMSQPTMWDAFAKEYNGYARLEREYTKFQIDAMRLDPQDTLLDIGAGPGRISIPASARVKSVTALDTSRRMLDELERNAREANAGKLHTLHLPWDEVVPGNNVAIHDVVVASRSPAMNDLAKIDAIARKYVYIMTFARGSLKHFHDMLVAGTDLAEQTPTRSNRAPLPGNTLLYNRVADMGIEVNVCHVPSGFTEWYPDCEAACRSFDWLDLETHDQPRFRANLMTFLKPERNGVRLRWETRTVITWWEKGRRVDG